MVRAATPPGYRSVDRGVAQGCWSRRELDQRAAVPRGCEAAVLPRSAPRTDAPGRDHSPPRTRQDCSTAVPSPSGVLEASVRSSRNHSEPSGLTPSSRARISLPRSRVARILSPVAGLGWEPQTPAVTLDPPRRDAHSGAVGTLDHSDRDDPLHPRRLLLGKRLRGQCEDLEGDPEPRGRPALRPSPRFVPSGPRTWRRTWGPGVARDA